MQQTCIVVAGLWIEAINPAAEPAASAERACATAQAGHLEGGTCINAAARGMAGAVHAPGDAARAVVLVERGLVIGRERVSAATKNRRTPSIVDHGRGVVVGAQAVRAPAVDARAVCGVGSRVEIDSSRVDAARHGTDAQARQRGSWVVVECA